MTRSVHLRIVGSLPIMPAFVTWLRSYYIKVIRAHSCQFTQFDSRIFFSAGRLSVYPNVHMPQFDVSAASSNLTLPGFQNLACMSRGYLIRNFIFTRIEITSFLVLVVTCDRVDHALLHPVYVRKSDWILFYWFK